MITTAFSTRCLKSACLSLFGWAVAWMLVVAPAIARAEGAPVEITQLRVERADDGLYLSAQLRVDLPAIMVDTLNKGVALHFVAEAELLRDRWYWYDRKLALATKYIRLAYQPLTRRWRINVSPEPIGNAGLGVSITQNFESLDDALQALQRQVRWRIGDSALLEPDSRHYVEFRFRLDTTQLPRPFQIGVFGNSEWDFSASRTYRLGPESGK